jgi:hypothetical protein
MLLLNTNGHAPMYIAIFRPVCKLFVIQKFHALILVSAMETRFGESMQETNKTLFPLLCVGFRLTNSTTLLIDLKTNISHFSQYIHEQKGIRPVSLFDHDDGCCRTAQ